MDLYMPLSYENVPRIFVLYTLDTLVRLDPILGLRR